ncbi:glycosyltransferase family 2 protein [Ramlibacter alkalitolerans]|uniref:Glycosyltransferase n=1 Tax=Ramlibacter alkalitolerans TaxID=2039631 RepID=A0ABS1JHY9_9BURK|nr:glycosyltransferase [Ramlibacter alkalitolerans]
MKVSICIPAYRQVEYLRETLRSVAEQEFQDYELIVSDDSPDDSVRALLSEFDFGDRLTYVRNEPALGSPENWNASIRLARGEYVKILHHDDHFTRPDALRRFVELLDADPEADFAFAGSRVVHVDSGVQRVHAASAQQLADLRADPATLFLGNCIGAPSATICRRRVGIDYDRRMKWLVDVDYYYRLLMRNGRFACTGDALISTPTNASHQVTQVCRDDARVELGEALMMFAKFTPAQRELPQVRRGWHHLFRRFRIRQVGDFVRYGVALPADPTCLEEMLRRAPHGWRLLLARVRAHPPKQLALKAFYRLYPHVPAAIRQPLKRIARSLGYLGGQR